MGEYESALVGKIEGKEVTASFNHRFLIDGVSGIKHKEIIFELTDEEGAAVLKPADGDDYLYIIMPIKST